MRRNLPKIQNLLSLSEVPGKGNYFRYLTLSQNSTSCAEKASSIIGLLFFFSPFKNKKRKTFFFFFAKRMSHWDGIRLYFSCLICNFLRVVECLGLPRCYWKELRLFAAFLFLWIQAVIQLGDANEFLNERAVVVMARMSNKLTGRDFSASSVSTPYPQYSMDHSNLILGDSREVEHGLSVKLQVQKLINQARSSENLCQNYVGYGAYLRPPLTSADPTFVFFQMKNYPYSHDGINNHVMMLLISLSTDWRRVFPSVSGGVPSGELKTQGKAVYMPYVSYSSLVIYHGRILGFKSTVHIVESM